MAVCKSSMSGRRKLRYKSEGAAWAAVSEMQDRLNKPFNAYFCFVCFHWHIGKDKPKILRDEVLVGKLIGILRGQKVKL